MLPWSGRNHMAVTMAHAQLSLQCKVPDGLRSRLQPDKAAWADEGLLAATPAGLDQRMPGKDAARRARASPECSGGVCAG